MLKLVKVSVIVPVYNVEEYIRECLDSLCNQSLADIEIICVDDGSTDSSKEILKEYESQQSNITVINQENKGLSGARNTGMKHASGEYIYFIDSDDMLVPTALEVMYFVADKLSLDLLIFKIINFDDETRQKIKSDYYDMEFLKDIVGENVFSHNDVSDVLFRIAVTIQGKLFKRELIQDMEFVEGLIFEDNPFFIEAILNAKRIYFLDDYLYLKRVRSGSITQSADERFYDYIPISEMLIDICKRYGVYDLYKSQLYAKTIGNIFFRFTEVSDEYKLPFFEKIKQYFSSKKEEYDNDEVFQNGDERYREIFYKGLDLDTPLEYELSIELFDWKKRFYVLKKDKTKTNQDRKKFLKRAHVAEDKVVELKAKNREMKRENRALNKRNKKLNIENDKLKRENENVKQFNNEILNSTSWKITEPLRSTKAKLKK